MSNSLCAQVLGIAVAVAAASGASAQPAGLPAGAASDAPEPTSATEPVAPPAAPTQTSIEPATTTTPAPGALADARLTEVRSRVEAATHSAVEAGLPAEWLLDKVAEGLAKGVPPGQIISAVDHLGARMRAAARIQRQLRPAHDRAESRATLRGLVDALSVGAPEAAIARFAHDLYRSDPGAVRAGIDAVADLGERGFRGEAAVRAVEVAFERGGRDGMTRLLASADAIGGNHDATRMQALTAAANRITRGSTAPGNALGRDHAPTRPVGPVRDRGAARGRGAASIPVAPGVPAHPGRARK